MERLGSGIRFMLDETKRMGLPPPQFREMNEFVVTFRKAPTSSIAEPKTLFPAEFEQNVLEKKPSEVPERVGIADQETRFVLAMHHVQEYGSITNGEYRELTGISESTANRDLEALVEKGALRMVGKTRGRRYKLP